MLFEEKTLLIVPEVELALPIALALHSLIYPLKMCNFVPCLLNYGEDFDNNSIATVNSPLSYFIGIC